MNFICWLFGHKWNYNFSWFPNKRKSQRCHRIEKGTLNTIKKDFHPLKDDPMIWKKI